MCGRCACTLNPQSLSRSCSYRNTLGKYREAQWLKSETEYIPSTNLGPRDVLSCLVPGQRFGIEDERALCPMMWGFIPPWTVGDYKKHNMSTHNARIESLRDSRLYSPALRRGQRCVVVCEGFYEWKAGQLKKDLKQPYYIYAVQEGNVKVDDPATWPDEWSEEHGWQGLQLLKMAGIYGTFETAEGKRINSCTIITKDADPSLSWLHHRSPAFLFTERLVETWLDITLSADEALEKLTEVKLSEGALKWHPVSTVVNNVSNKSDNCRKEIRIQEEKKNASSNFMASWLKRSAVTKRKGSVDEKDSKLCAKAPRKE